MLTISNSEFKLLSDYIKYYSGINLKNEKKTLLVGRLNNMLMELNISSFNEYYRYLKNDTTGIALSRLVDKITTNHTFFMREPEHFKYFFDEILPYLEKTVLNHDIRIWCAASSSGEEPYTIALLLNEYFKNNDSKWNKKLLATDLSTSILEKAKAGIYTKNNIEKLPKVWVLNYFDKDTGNYVIKNFLKKEVIYRRFNLLEPVFPFKKKFHVIFCRNVMIYFNNETKDELIDKFYNSLEYGGYLIIGHSETINRHNTKFKYIKPAIYRKI